MEHKSLLMCACVRVLGGQSRARVGHKEAVQRQENQLMTRFCLSSYLALSLSVSVSLCPRVRMCCSMRCVSSLFVSLCVSQSLSLSHSLCLSILYGAQAICSCVHVCVKKVCVCVCAQASLCGLKGPSLLQVFFNKGANTRSSMSSKYSVYP